MKHDSPPALAPFLPSAATAEELRAYIRDTQRLMSYYRCAMLEVETKFKVLNEQFSIHYERNPIESIKCRLKSFESIREKLGRKGLPLSLDAIERHICDVAGIRVICSYLDDIYRLADCLLSQDDVTLIERKDYIEHPKENGYRSLHLIVEIPIFLSDEKKSVKAEVQLRTIAMESWANLEHSICYKRKLSPSVKETVSARLLQNAEQCYRMDLNMLSIRRQVEEDSAENT